MPESERLVSYRRAGRLVRRGLEAFARQLRETAGQGRGFHCLLTDDRELRRLNREFRGRDYPTDVLSFPESDEPGRAFLGELAISAERAREQAARYGHRAEDEIRILMLHGVLHLTGFDHERDRGRMARAEARWRTRLGLPAGLIERTKS